MSKFEDLTGKRFGRLTVVERYIEGNNSSTKFKCICDCGNTRIVAASHLKDGHTKSCGCLSREIVSKRNFVHGLEFGRLYKIWTNMKTRCKNPKVYQYKSYGGRGIKVCKEWEKYENFHKWAMSSGYKENLTLDRTDCNGDYCPENCRWISMKEQQNNRTNNHILSLNGEKHTISEWADITGIEYYNILARTRLGWSDEKVLTTPVRKCKTNG